MELQMKWFNKNMIDPQSEYAGYIKITDDARLVWTDNKRMFVGNPGTETLSAGVYRLLERKKGAWTVVPMPGKRYPEWSRMWREGSRGEFSWSRLRCVPAMITLWTSGNHAINSTFLEPIKKHISTEKVLVETHPSKETPLVKLSHENMPGFWLIMLLDLRRSVNNFDIPVANGVTIVRPEDDYCVTLMDVSPEKICEVINAHLGTIITPDNLTFYEQVASEHKLVITLYYRYPVNERNSMSEAKQAEKFLEA